MSLSHDLAGTRAREPLHLIRKAEQKRMAWKNGGGTTTEIAVCPRDASLDTFEWRVSTADVVADGAFSMFAGVDRTLALLSGAGLMLTVGDAAPVHLSPQSPPFAIGADTPTHATLTDGPVIDLNVMSRRGRWRHTVARIDHAARHATAQNVAAWLVYCRSGNVRVTAAGGSVMAGAEDAVVGFATQLAIEPQGTSTAYLIAFHKET